ncbi:MAG: TetR/AcrR family transcriptional regulator [Myxococcaceae bacterium]|jgi:AcrR family transcriptional regulator|nr:TetR/AcrR family transcriptional regulator [Myxococcaceae bacterium]
MTEPLAEATPARERILTAALEEFATRGYEAASTNTIASRAGVAKGLVFHHFGSKEALFEVLFEREVTRFTDLVLEPQGPSASDLFERLHQVTLRKLELAQQFPLTAEFLVVALTEAPLTLKPKLAARQAQLLKESWPRVLAGIDPSPLRDGLALGDAVETVGLLSEGLEKQLTAMLKSRTLTMAEVAARAWRHFERLRDGLYRR